MRHMMNLESVKTYGGTNDPHTRILGENLAGAMSGWASEASS
jgi:glutaryl-CoA dehydrogenase